MMARKETVSVPDKTVYFCGACGYDSSFERDVLEHEEKHGRNQPFEVGMEVSYTTAEQGSDHGKDFEYGQSHTGKIVSFSDHDPTYDDDEQFDDGRYALVEGESGNRAWVGEYELREENAVQNALDREKAERDAQKEALGEWKGADDERNQPSQGYASYGSTAGGSISASTDFSLSSDSGPSYGGGLST